jgi:signal transduction histidine kinase
MIAGGVSGHLLDVSQGGFRLLAAADDMNLRIAPGSRIDCTLELPLIPQQSLSLAAQVIRRDDTPAGVELASRFVDLRDDDRLHLAHFIDHVLADALNAAERARNAFLHGMSHQIRTPLNAIIGFSQLGLASPGLKPKQRDYFADINRAGDEMLEFLDSLLTLAASEADPARGTTLPRVERIGALLSGAVIAALPTAKREQVLLRLTPPQENPLALVALEPLREILNGLMRGAIAEAGPKGEVSLGCRDLDDGRISIDVRVRPTVAAGQRQQLDHAAWNGSSGGSALAALYLTAVQSLADAVGASVRAVDAGNDDAMGFELVLPAPAAVMERAGRLAS